jgi:hypothetical protein
MHLGSWHKTAVLMTTAIVGLTGLFWFVLHDVIDDQAGEVVHVLLMLHGISSYVLLVVIGSLLPGHVRSGWTHRRNVATGLAVTAMMAALAMTGLALYYGGEELQNPAKWLHLAVGLGCFVLFPAHAFLTSHSRRHGRCAAGEDATRQREWAAGDAATSEVPFVAEDQRPLRPAHGVRNRPAVSLDGHA